MTDTLTRQEASDAVSDLGWRHVLGALRAFVPVVSLDEAVEVAMLAVDEGGPGLRLDLRPDRVALTLEAPLTAEEVDAARRISAAMAEMGRPTRPDADAPRSVQALEIAIDALDIPSVLPFWRAVLGYVDEPGSGDSPNAVIDPVGQGPAVWFQQMDAPRPQRNRIHIDVSVPHDAARGRIDAALAAGGRLLNDAQAPAFWVLADPEGNEACVCTWQGRD